MTHRHPAHQGPYQDPRHQDPRHQGPRHQGPRHQGPHHEDPHHRDPAPSAFAGLMYEVMTDAERFGHRQHVRLTWLAVRRYGTAAAVGLVSEGIQGVARYAGAPQKYNATVSRAWVELVAHHTAHTDTDDFATFAERNPDLFDKRLLTRFYRSSTLAGTQARSGWVAPDLAPFPWHHVLP